MGRRASSSLNSTAIIGIIAVIALLVGIGSLMLKKKADTFSEVAPLRVAEALVNANSLRGNQYRVEGKIESRWIRDSGEGLSLLVEEEGLTERLFIMIPPDLDHPNIERDQRYAFKIEFGAGGVAIATAVKRL